MHFQCQSKVYTNYFLLFFLRKLNILLLFGLINRIIIIQKNSFKVKSTLFSELQVLIMFKKKEYARLKSMHQRKLIFTSSDEVI